MQKTCEKKLGETQKQKGDKENEGRRKKKRSNGSETLLFLREKNEMQQEIRKEEMELKKKNTRVGRGKK